MSIKKTLFLSLLIASLNLLAQEDLNVIERAMKDEMERSIQELKSDKYDPPFFIRYRITDQRDVTVIASLGSIQQSSETPVRSKDIRVMVGDYDFNDESLDDNLENNSSPFGYMDFNVPLGNDYFGIRRSLWITTDAIYKQAAKIYKNHLTSLEKDGKKLDEINHRRFAKVPVVEYVEDLKEMPFSKKELEDFAKINSAAFNEYHNLFASTIRANAGLINTYMLNSEGIKYRTSEPYAQVIISAAMLSKMEAIRYETFTYELATGDSLPTQEDIKTRIAKMVQDMESLDETTRFEDSYYGPVLLMGKVVPELLSSYLVNQLYASTVVINENDYYGYGGGSTLDERIGKRIISKNLSVSIHPNMEKWNGKPLRGAYKIDPEGVMAPDTLILIENGKLKNLMSTRTLVKEDQKANGTGYGPGVVSITAVESSTDQDLKEKLIQLSKENDQKYGIIIRPDSGSGGLYAMNVFKVNVETGEEELVTDANISEFDLNKLLRVAGVSSKRVLNEVSGASYITPNALLLEDIGISSGYQQMKIKGPLVDSPLLEKE